MNVIEPGRCILGHRFFNGCNLCVCYGEFFGYRCARMENCREQRVPVTYATTKMPMMYQKQTGEAWSAFQITYGRLLNVCHVNWEINWSTWFNSSSFVFQGRAPKGRHTMMVTTCANAGQILRATSVRSASVKRVTP